MKKWLLALVAALPSLALADDFLISTPRTSLLLEGEPGQSLRILYYGDRVGSGEVGQVKASGVCSYSEAYPAFGFSYNPELALAVELPDGQLSLQLVLDSTARQSGDGWTDYTFTLRDRKEPFYVKLHYKAYDRLDVIEMRAEVFHRLKRPVVLRQCASGYLPLRSTEAWISHLYGNWGNEGRLQQEPLTTGLKVIQNRDGVRNSHTRHAEVMFSLDGRPQERQGRVVGAALCWGGNYSLRVNKESGRQYDFLAGIDPLAADYHLERGEVFATPELAVTYSGEGTGQASRNFHRWARATHLAHGDRPRDILLNSWEGVYLAVDEAKMKGMIQDIAALGGELFVMDDGWFGRKYRRDRDNAALGDWEPDTAKLPGGIAPLAGEAKRCGVKFGIWIEPEMTNTKSELFEAHPDWIVCPEGRQPSYGRGGTQLLLDLSNPEVQDFVFGVVDRLKTECPDLAYIKWDANMSLVGYGSSYLPAGRQSHLFTAYHRGLLNVLKRIRAKYPDLVIQACASGGGRANYGLLPYFDEFWVSDNTDALQRVYMQWGHSYFFPSMAMASHVSASPNHQTGRRIPLRFRFAVAMSARLGMEMQPRDMSEGERDFARSSIADYKTIRPVVQQGDLYRLVSPYDGKGVASLMYVSPDRGQAVFFAYKLEHFVAQEWPDFRMDGLDPGARYRVTELNLGGARAAGVSCQVFTGRFLMESGLSLPLSGEYASHVLRLERVD